MKTIEERAKENFVSVEYQAALDRVAARGIKKHEYAFEVALREELGVTASEAEAAELAVIKAADERLAKGEAALHATRVAARKGAQ